MSVDTDLYGPVMGSPLPVVAPLTAPSLDGILRQKFSLSVDIQRSQPRSVYSRIAVEMMDHIALEHKAILDVMDVRNIARDPKPALDLGQLVQRFYDGETEIWISRPNHMSPGKFKFEGRFGYCRANRMPLLGMGLTHIAWSWIITEEGHLQAIDLGLIMLPTNARWYRVFRDEAEAESYYQS